MRSKTVTVLLALPPVPLQLSVKPVDAVIGGVVSAPLVARPPDQPPEAVQLVAFVVVQLSTELSPLSTLVGFAVREIVGIGRIVTVTVLAVLPPAPVQVRRKLREAVRLPVLCEPLSGLLPLQPCEAVQLVALLEDQVSVEAVPEATAVGLAVSVTVGAGEADTETVALAAPLPPVPVQVSV
jgi:hypothetical protein